MARVMAGVSWASVHWQYLEDMGKVTEHNLTPLKLEKKLFVRRNTDKGPVLEEVKGPVAVGDELVTRVVLRNDRAMEFVHLKDLRPAVVALIASAALTMLTLVVFGSDTVSLANINWLGAVLFAAALIVLRVKKWHPVLVMLLCGVVNLAVYVLGGIG